MLSFASLRQDQVVHLQVLIGQAVPPVFPSGIPETEGEKVDEAQDAGETDPPQCRNPVGNAPKCVITMNIS